MIKKFRNTSLVILFCSLFFENLPMITAMIGVIFVFLYVLTSLMSEMEYRVGIQSYDFKRLVKLWIVLFVFLSMITIFYPSSYTTDIIDLKWFRAILYFAIVFGTVVDNKILQKRIIYLFPLTGILCSVLLSMGIGLSIDMEDIGESRLSFFKMNVNKLAILYCYAFACSLHIIDDDNSKKKLIRWSYAAISILSSLYVISLTGSRGSFIIIFPLLTYYFFTHQKNRGLFRRFCIIVVGLFAIYYAYNSLMSSDVMTNRIETSQEGDIGERDILIRSGLKIFYDNPIWGVGIEQVKDQIYEDIDERKTPHNLYIYILAAGGFIGFSIFLSIIVRIVRIIYLYAHKQHLCFPVLVCIIAFLDYAKNGAALSANMNYMFLSFALAMSLDHKNQ